MDNLQITDQEVHDRLRSTVKKKKRKLKPRKRFEPQWVKLPIRWIKVLKQSTSAGTYRLALMTLIGAFKCEQRSKDELVLSKEMTGMSGSARARAVAA